MKTTEKIENTYFHKYFNLLFFTGFLLGIILSLTYSNNQILTGDQLQMIHKGYLGAYEGIWLNYGNVASAVGDVPGSLSAYIVGLPIILWNSPWAPMLFLVLLHVVSFFMLDSIIKKVFEKHIRLLFMVLYWLNPWFLFESLLYNPSYLFVFSALHLWSAFHMYEKKSLLYSFLHILSIGLAMQLHYSWPVLALISSYLLYRRIIQIHWTGVFLGFLTIAITLIPYLQELLINRDLQGNPGNKDGERYIGWGGVHVYPVIKAMFYWVRYASFLFASKLMLGATFDWISSVETVQKIAMYSWRAILYTVGVSSIWIAWKINKAAWIQIKPHIKRQKLAKPISKENWLLLYSIGVLIAIFISSILSPISFIYWHLILTFGFALFPILVYFSRWSKIHTKKYARYFPAVVIYFILVNLIAAHDSKKYTYKNSYSAEVGKYLEQNNFSKISL